MINAKQCAVLCEVFKQPPSQNLTYQLVLGLLTALGASPQPTKSGAIVVFSGGVVWSTHRPHPRPNMDKAAIVALRKALTVVGLTPAHVGCTCKP